MAVAPLAGHVAVEPGREGEVVLGQVEHALGRVVRHRLVREPSGLAERPGVREAARGDLEDVAVPLLQGHVGRAREVGADVGAVDGLLAGDPGAPRHLAAAAVHHRAAQAGVGVLHLAVPRHLDRGRARAAALVVRLGRTERRLRVVDLVVAHQKHRPAGPGEGAHPVVPAGQQGAVAQRHRRARVVERAVGEAGRQVESYGAVAGVGDRDQRADGSAGEGARPRERGGVGEPGERAGGEGATEGSLDGGAAVELHEGDLRGRDTGGGISSR